VLLPAALEIFAATDEEEVMQGHVKKSLRRRSFFRPQARRKGD
jgi:hypothetical protein